MRIDVRIEELVLHGIDSRERYRVADALEAELGRILSERGVPESLSEDRRIESLDLGSFQISCNKPESIGRGLALAIYNWLCQ